MFILIREYHQGARECPLEAAKGFILSQAPAHQVNVSDYPTCLVLGPTYISAGAEYQVDIVFSDDGIHAYFRWPSCARFPVLEIMFFRSGPRPSP